MSAPPNIRVENPCSQAACSAIFRAFSVEEAPPMVPPMPTTRGVLADAEVGIGGASSRVREALTTLCVAPARR